MPTEIEERSDLGLGNGVCNIRGDGNRSGQLFDSGKFARNNWNDLDDPNNDIAFTVK